MSFKNMSLSAVLLLGVATGVPVADVLAVVYIG
jgi:hypothetical protein